MINNHFVNILQDLLNKGNLVKGYYNNLDNVIMKEREEANQIIDSIDQSGIFEKSNELELFRVKKVNESEYIVNIVDSDVTQDNHKTYSHDRPGLEEFLTALLTNEASILHRL